MIGNFTYEEIPAYHSFCDCRVTFDKSKYKKFYEGTVKVNNVKWLAVSISKKKPGSP